MYTQGEKYQIHLLKLLSVKYYNRLGQQEISQKEIWKMADYNELLERLKAGDLESITIEKDQFLQFREVLIAREDFKHFRGEAFHHGKTIYRYTEEASK